MRLAQQSGIAVIEQDRVRPAGPGALWGHSAAATILLLAFGAAPARAASYRLSQGLPSSHVSPNNMAPSPDGRYVVYVHDAVVESAMELWSVAVAGGAPVRLSGLLPAGVSIEAFTISPDGERVVYRVAQQTAGQSELYSIPIAGPEGAWIRLNAPLPAFGDVGNFALSPDSAHVVYLADQQTDEVYDAWSVPIDGGTPIRVRPVGALPGSHAFSGGLQVSPDGARVVFRGNFSVLERTDLWSARLDGVSEVTRLSAELASFGNVMLDFQVSPDSARVVYRANQQAEAVVELYSVPLAGGATVKLNGAMVAEGDLGGFEISADSARVVYRADQQVDEVVELYSVPLAGGAAVKLNGVLAPGGDVTDTVISPDRARVVYVADQQTDDVFELYSVPLAGGVATKLNAPLPLGGDVSSAAAISADSARVVYLADQQTDEVRELYSVPLAGGAKVRISDALVADGDIVDFRIAPASDFVFYRGDVVTDGVDELFRSPIAFYNVADTHVSGPMVAGGGVSAGWTTFPNDRQAIYVADQEVDVRMDLYVGDACLLCDGFEAGAAQRWD